LHAEVLLRLAPSGETTRQTKVVKKLPIDSGVHSEFAAIKAEFRDDKHARGRHFNLLKFYMVLTLR